MIMRQSTPPDEAFRSAAQAERILLFGALAMLLVSAFLGNSAGVGAVTGSGPWLVAHVHAGSLGWLTLAVLAVALRMARDGGGSDDRERDSDRERDGFELGAGKLGTSVSWLTVATVAAFVLATATSSSAAEAPGPPLVPVWPGCHRRDGAEQSGRANRDERHVINGEQQPPRHQLSVASQPGYGDGLPLRSGGAYVSAFDAAGSKGCSGSPVVCVPMWTTTGLPESIGNTGSPAIANGVIYIANATLYAFDAAGSTKCSGTPKVCAPLWTAATSSSPTYSAPAVADGTVYVDSWNARLYAFAASGKTNCSTKAAVKTCTPLWTAGTPYSIGGTPAVAYGTVYTVSADGTLSAFSAAGSKNCSGTVKARKCKPLWTSATGGSGYATLSSPAVANGVVYFSSTNGGTYGYGAAGSLKCSVSRSVKTCRPLWGAVTGFIGGGSAAVVNGVLYINVGTIGRLYAYSLPASSK